MTENHSLQSRNGEGDGEENTEKETKTLAWWPSLGRGKQGIDRWPNTGPLVEDSKHTQDDSGQGLCRALGTQRGVPRILTLPLREVNEEDILLMAKSDTCYRGMEWVTGKCFKIPWLWFKLSFIIY